MNTLQSGDAGLFKNRGRTTISALANRSVSSVRQLRAGGHWRAVCTTASTHTTSPST